MLWDSSTGDPIARLVGHAGWVFTAVFSDDGRLIASGGADGTGRIWDAQTGEQRLTLPGHDGWVTFCAFSQNGRWLLTGGHNLKRLRLWNVATGELASHYAITPERDPSRRAWRRDAHTFVAGDVTGAVHLLKVVSPSAAPVPL
jgi:WD40 repeat protein